LLRPGISQEFISGRYTRTQGIFDAEHEGKAFRTPLEDSAVVTVRGCHGTGENKDGAGDPRGPASYTSHGSGVRHKRPCAYTFPSDENLRRTKRKVKALTTRSTRNLSLEQILRAINPVLRGIAYYYRHAAAKRHLQHLARFAWWRVARWLTKKHARRGWRWLRRRYRLWGPIRVDDVTLFDPGRVAIVRYYFRGAKIGTPWNTEQLQGYGAHYRHARDERADLDHLQRTLVG
jgi:hypothetical protein